MFYRKFPAVLIFQLKGVDKSQVLPHCTEMLKDMELYPKLKAKSKNLSGGMKRKLSVCIALIGGSKVTLIGGLKVATSLFSINIALIA